MRYSSIVFAVVLLLITRWLQSAEQPKDAPPQQAAVKQSPDWAMNTTIIEACSCPMFCQCYFDTKPAAHASDGKASGDSSDKPSAASDGQSKADAHAAHADHAGEATHFCKFNNAYKVNRGQYGETKLDGAKFWLSGDLGHDFSKGEMNWAVLTFDSETTPAQREAIQAILNHIFAVNWKSFTVADPKPIEWKAERDLAHARLDGGKAAEVILEKNQGMSDEPIVIQNMKYWGAPRNDGFVLMQNRVQALRQAPQGQQPYEFKRTNGFMITFDINSNDVAASKT